MKRILFALALVSLMIAPVMADYDNYWDTHYIVNGGANGVAVEGTAPNGIVYLYADTEEQISDTIGDIKSATGETLINRAFVYYMWYDGVPIIGLWWSGTYPNSDSDFFGVTRAHYNSVGSLHDRNLAGDPEGNALQAYVQLSASGWTPIGPLYVLRNGYEPLEADFTYDPAQPWIAPLEVTFTDASTGPLADTITWELESLDGPYVYGYAQAMDEVTWRFDYAGTYQVNLTLTNGSVSNSKTETFTVYNPTDLQFGIQIIDDDIPFGGTTEAELVGGQTGNITAIRWYAYYPGQTAPQDFYESGSDSKRLNYALKDGNWMGWDDSTTSFSNNAGATLPNPVILKPEYAGEVLVGCYVFLDELWQNPVSSITVGEGQGLQTIRFTAQDALTSSVISPVTFNIQKLSDGSWTNQSQPGTGQIQVNYPAGTSLNVEVLPPDGSDYDPSTIVYQVTDTPGFIQDKIIKMWKGASEDPGNTTANVIVKHASTGQPIKGVNIVLSSGGSCTTPASGSCQFTVVNDTPIYADLTATGYYPENYYFRPFGSSHLQEFNLYPIGWTPTPVFTYPTTSGPGGTPTGTYVPGGTTVPGGIVTLDPGMRGEVAVEGASNVWIENAEFLSTLIFLAVVVTVASMILFAGSKRK